MTELGYNVDVDVNRAHYIPRRSEKLVFFKLLTEARFSLLMVDAGGSGIQALLPSAS